MKIVEKYTGEKTYMFPSGGLGTKENVLKEFPAALTFTHIVTTDENREVMFALQNLSAMRTNLNIDSSLSEDEAIAAIQEIINTPEPVNTEPTVEERTAAALEFIAMSSLPDDTTTTEEPIVEETVVAEETTTTEGV